MRKVTKVLAGFFILLWILIATCYIYIRLNGRAWVIGTLSQIFEQPVGLKNIHFLFPFGARITELSVGDTLQVKDVQLQIGVPDFLHKRFHLLLLNLSEPVVMIQRNADSKIVFGNLSPEISTAVETTSSLSFEKNAERSSPLAASPKKSFNLIVDYLLVTKGEVRFRDYSRERNFQLTLRDVNIKAQSMAVPVQPVNTKFDLTATLFQNDLSFSGSRIKAEGWANFYAKNMQATLEVAEPDGKVALSAVLDSKNNNLAIDGKVHMTNLIPQAAVPSEETSLKGLIFSSLQSSGVEIVADFHSQTKMDDIQLDSILFSGNVGYKPIGQGSPSEAQSSGVETKNIGEHFEELGKKFYKENIESGREMMNKEVSSSP